MHIPYYLSGGQSFFDRSEIKDVFAYLRLVANPDDDLGSGGGDDLVVEVHDTNIFA